MIVNNAYRSRNSVPRPAASSCRAGAFGLALGMIAAIGGAHAAPASAVVPTLAQVAPVSPMDPAKQLPARIEVADIDFNRGEGGSGKLTLRFNHPGAMADLQNEASRIVIQVPNATLPVSLQRPLDVSDFATPVEDIQARAGAGGATIVLDTRGDYETMAYQSDNQYIVEVMPRAEPQQLATSEAQLGNGVALPGERTYSGQAVTFNFQDVPVRTVLQLIAEESNLNIVVSDSVSGNVTLRLINVPWDQALDIVLRAKGLDKRRNGNVVWVAPQAELATYEQNIQDARLAIENSAELQTEFIPVNYANAEEIARLLTESSRTSGSGVAGAGTSGGFLSPRGSISADARTNTLLVIDIPDRVAEIRGLVMQLDKPVDQVLIEARIVIATESFARELGAKFGIGGSDGSYNDQSSVGIGNTTDASRDNAEARADAIADGDPSGRHDITNGLNVNLPTSFTNAGALALSILNAGYMLDIELSALQQEGRGEVISNPRIVTSNQKEAIIRQGQEVGYVTISPSQGAGTIPIPNVQFKDVLLELAVTPTITNDGRVFMNLVVKKDEIEGFVDTSIGDVPTISTREVTTAVLVEDGQTVVIGGVYEFRDREDVTKVPFLGDLPFIGNLFRSKGRSHEKAELLIFVTPKVMRVAQRGG
ncbi:MAG TPA: type IV pilus secretin PilQ family protein [Xanthomonadaceae bacterium]|nr:type IV pilus secretin PilQ family protein [Xanthomonadaceae bacterium]